MSLYELSLERKEYDLKISGKGDPIAADYWVDAINEDKAYGRSGFVYEAGSLRYQFSSGNHIHLPSDARILNSPEYVKYFWALLNL